MLKSKIRLKSAEDIRRIRQSGRILAKAFRTISEMNLTGMSTWEIDSVLDGIILKYNARPAFKTLRKYDFASCVSVNDEIVHGIPSRKKIICDGDIVKIDSGVALNGYFSDSCITLIAGGCNDNIPGRKKLVETSGMCLLNALKLFKPGVRLGDIGCFIENYALGRGFFIQRDLTGHGTGFSLHEPPVVPHWGKKNTGLVLEPGMVLAVEPVLIERKTNCLKKNDGWTIVSEDGSLSAQFEHTVAVTDKGPLVLTD